MQRNEPRNNTPERLPSLVQVELRHGPGENTAKLRSADVRVAPKVARRLRSQIATFRDLPDYDLDPTYYEDTCANSLEKAAPELVEALRQLREAGDPALISIFGLQIDDTPVATPLDGSFNQRDAPVELAIQAGIVRHLGIRAVAFATENDGRIVRPVCPVRKYAEVSSSQGAKVDLVDHSDNGHLCIPHSNDTHPYRLPAVNAFQSFSTITPITEVPMRVRLLDDVLDNLDPGGGDFRQLEQFADLQRAEYRFCSPPSHGDVHRLEPLPLIVTLENPAVEYGLRFHGKTASGTTPRAEAALALFRFAMARTPERVITTRRGDVILYDNRRATHRREPYDARFDGTDRFYLRVYGQPAKDVEQWARSLHGNGRVA